MRARMPQKLKPKAIEQTEKLFQIYKQGKYSVRALAQMHGIPFTTLRDRFRMVFGLDYTRYRAGEGTLYYVVQESIANLPKHRTTDKEKCLKWLAENKEYLINMAYQDQTSHKPRVFTRGRMDSDTRYGYQAPQDIASWAGDDKYSPYLEEEGEQIYLHQDY